MKPRKRVLKPSSPNIPRDPSIRAQPLMTTLRETSNLARTVPKGGVRQPFEMDEFRQDAHEVDGNTALAPREEDGAQEQTWAQSEAASRYRMTEQQNEP